MKNLQLTKLGFLLFLVLLCGCSDSFVIDTPAEAGNSYESDVHVLNKFVDISEPVQKYYINPNKKSTVLSYITNSDLEELNAVNSLSASRYEKSLFRLNEKISQAISSHTVDYVVMCTSSQIFVDRINDDSPIELKSAGFTTLSDNLVVSLLDISSEEMSSREIYSRPQISSQQKTSTHIYPGNLVQTGLELNPSLYARDHWIFRIRCEVGEPTDRKMAWVLFCGVGYFSAASFNWLALDSYDNRVSWNFTGESMLDETMPSIAQMVFFK